MSAGTKITIRKYKDFRFRRMKQYIKLSRCIRNAGRTAKDMNVKIGKTKEKGTQR